jgi:hypothetical protein
MNSGFEMLVSATISLFSAFSVYNQNKLLKGTTKERMVGAMPLTHGIVR